MSALGHFIEEEGIAAVAIALIRPQAEHTRPPRALWVPFELGRPFGPPSDAAFQERVIRTALGLLESAATEGPVRIVDFTDDDPREAPDAGWRPPTRRRAGAPPGDGLLAEVADLASAYAQSRRERGRTTVGLSGLTPGAAADYAAAWLNGPAASPIAGMSPVLALRFAVDDLKAYALEAALAGGARPSSRQLGDWLWNDSATGEAIRALRHMLLAQDDDRAKLVANFMVPGLRLAASG